MIHEANHTNQRKLSNRALQKTTWRKKKQRKLKAADQIQTQTFPILPTQRICFPNLKPLETTIYEAVSQNKKQILPRT